MKTLTKAMSGLLITGLLSTALITTPAFAKDHDHERNHGAKIEKIAKKLELTDAQTVSFTEIMQVQGEKRQALREEIKTQQEALKMETLASLETILDEEQLARVEKMMERGRKHHKGK